MAKTKKVVINGKERTMKYPVYSMVRMQEEQNVSINDLQDKKKSQDMRVILAIVWAGLIHEDPDLTIAEIGNSVDISELPELAQAMGEIFEGMNTKKGK